MSTTRTDINNLINDLRRDSTTNSIDMSADGFRAINSTLQLWDTEHDWPWQIEKFTIDYNEGIDTYRILDAYEFKALVDIRPQSSANKRIEFNYVSNNKFDSDTINYYRCALKQEAQKKYLRLKYAGAKSTLNSATGVDNNGTWVGAGDISNLTKDQFETYDLPASLSFDIDGTAGTLTNETMEATDVSRYANRSSVYFNIFLQDVDDFDDIVIKVGSSASDYIIATIATDYLGEPIVAGWNKVGFVWDGTTTEVGTPDVTAFNYIEITLTYTSSVTARANRIENIFISENIPVEVEHYSHFMTSKDGVKSPVFTDSANPAQELGLWSGQWDFVTPQFANSTMELLFWMTGETQDRNTAIERMMTFLNQLKTKLPSKRRRHQIQMSADINIGNGATRYNRR